MSRAPRPTDDAFTTTEKVMQTFRMSRELVTFLKGEAAERGVDLTAHVVRFLDGVRTWFGLPHAAATQLEADRVRLGLGRYEYLLHVLFERSLAVREKGPGFDAPATGERRKR
jgi:hypothetical protein